MFVIVNNVEGRLPRLHPGGHLSGRQIGLLKTTPENPRVFHVVD